MNFSGKKVAVELKVTRRRSGLTQADVAHLLNVDRSLLSKFERGKRKPSGEQIALLCVIYGRAVPEMYEASQHEIYHLLARRIKTLPMEDGPSTRTEALHSLRDFIQAIVTCHGYTD